MTVNNFKIKIDGKDKEVTVPFATYFDESLGREQHIELYEKAEMQDNVNIIQDFETTRYSPETLDSDKHIFYSMQFMTNSTPSGDPNDYLPDYSVVGISHPDIVERKSNFIKSFFKFDFYDNPNPQTQRLYFSIISPINNGKPFVKGGPYDYLLQISNDPISNNYDPIGYAKALIKDENLAVPLGPPYYYDKLESSQFDFSSIGKNTENYYIQWLKNRDLVPYNIFYMSCKFFNAETGKTHKFINKVQPANTYTLSIPDYYYYQLIFDPIKYTYIVNQFDLTQFAANDGVGSQVGHSLTFDNPIKFYEYINP